MAQLVKNPPAIRETWIRSPGWEDPWRRERLPITVFWPGQLHVLNSPWGHKELDMTERFALHLHFNRNRIFNLYREVLRSLAVLGTLCGRISHRELQSFRLGTLSRVRCWQFAVAKRTPRALGHSVLLGPPCSIRYYCACVLSHLVVSGSLRLRGL